LLSEAAELAKAGLVTGASARNWSSYGQDVDLPTGYARWKRDLLTDPQTSGGLLLACAPQRAATIAAMIQNSGFPAARVIGQGEAGPPRLVVLN
jgi:selenide, water dikinase